MTDRENNGNKEDKSREGSGIDRGCYGPDISSSITTRKRPKQVSSGSAGDAGTSQAIGRGVAESHNVTRPVRNVGT